jgi:hypothetical protein
VITKFFRGIKRGIGREERKGKVEDGKEGWKEGDGRGSGVGKGREEHLSMNLNEGILLRGRGGALHQGEKNVYAIYCMLEPGDLSHMHDEG